MQTLTTDQHELLSYYFHLLNSIEEGFDSVVDSFQNLQFSESERIFSDIISAFYHIDSSNPSILSAIEANDELSKEITKFDSVIKTLEGLESIFKDPKEYHAFVKNQLTPSFLAWKEAVQSRMQPYITH